ncbi:MAG TPA: ABC transporter permease [Gemmataceae bacterium]|nr:ABC transporter permease [Gemmataceae bacterium]
MRFWELLRLALGGIQRTPLRVALTVLGVAIATGLWVSLIGFCLGVQRRIEEPFQRLELFNRLTISPARAAVDSADAPNRPEQPPPILDDEAIARILRLPGVTVAYPELRLGDVEVLEGKQVKHKTYALALPRQSGRLRYVQEGVSAGRFFSPGRGETTEVVLGRQLAKKLGFDPPGDAVGRTLTLRVKGSSWVGGRTFQFAQRQLEVQVVGIWDPARTAQFFSTDILLFPLDVMRELPGALSESALDLREGEQDGSPGYRHVVVRVERPADLFEVEERIKAMGFEPHNRLGEIKELREFFILMDLVWGSVGAVALLVAGLGIINTMLMAVLERYREIGVYKALGASDGDIRLMFLAEAGLVGVLGGALGLVLGRVVSWLCEIGFNAFARSKGIEEPMASAFPPQLLLSALAFAVVVSVLSGVYPASRAARIDPIRALRSE